MVPERQPSFLRRLFGHRDEAPTGRSNAAMNDRAQQAVSDITMNRKGGPDADAHQPAAALRLPMRKRANWARTR